jgi:hypothetical protein
MGGREHYKPCTALAADAVVGGSAAVGFVQFGIVRGRESGERHLDDSLGMLDLLVGAIVVPEDGIAAIDLDKDLLSAWTRTSSGSTGRGIRRVADVMAAAAYTMELRHSSLSGSGKYDDDYQGTCRVKEGDRIGVLAKLGVEGYVRFFKNDEPFGPGYEGGKCAHSPASIQWGHILA